MTATLVAGPGPTYTETPSSTESPTPTVSPTATETPFCYTAFGNAQTNDGSIGPPTGKVYFAPYVLTAPAEVTGLSVNMVSAPNALRMALYTDGVGQPGSLLAETAELFPGAAGMVGAPIASQLLSPGIYWLAVQLDQVQTIGTNASAFDIWALDSSYGAFPASSSGAVFFVATAVLAMSAESCPSPPTATVTPTLTDSASETETQTESPTVTATPSFTPAVCYTAFGDPNTSDGSYGSSADTVYFSPYVLVSPAEITALSVKLYGVPSTLRMALYTDGGSEAGTLLAETAELTPGGGGVFYGNIPPQTLSPGTYWLALQFSEAVSLGVNTSAFSIRRLASLYGKFPALGAGSSVDNPGVSLVMSAQSCPITPTITATATATATETPSISPTPLNCGMAGYNGDQAGAGGNSTWFFAQQVSIPVGAEVNSLEIFVKTAGFGQYQMGLYSDNSGSPGTLLVDTGVLPLPSLGLNSTAVTPTDVAPGTYWVAFSRNGAIDFSSGGGSFPGIYLATSFGLPATFPGGETVLGGVSFGLAAQWCEFLATPTETPSITPSSTATATETDVDSPTETVTETPVDTDTMLPTDTPVDTDTMTETPTETESFTATETPEDSFTATETPEDSFTATETPTETESYTVTETPEDSFTATETPTGTETETTTETPEDSFTATVTPTQTASETSTETPPDTFTSTVTGTATATQTGTATPTVTATGTLTGTGTATPTGTGTASRTPTATLTATGTLTGTGTATPTGTGTASGSPTATLTGTGTATPTSTGTASGSPTATLTGTGTATPTGTGTASGSPTATLTATNTPTTTGTLTGSSTGTLTASFTATPTTTGTSTGTSSATATGTETAVDTPTSTRTVTPSATPSSTGTAVATPTPSSTPTASPTVTATETVTATASATPTVSVTPSASASDTALPSATPSSTATLTPSASPTASPTYTETATFTVTVTFTGTPTATPSATYCPSVLLAGLGSPAYTGDGGPALLAELNGVYGVSGDANGRVWAADINNGAIRRVDAGNITTVAGGLVAPAGLFVDGAGIAYVADRGASTIVQINALGAVTVVAGTGVSGTAGLTTTALSTTLPLNQPRGLALAPDGSVYVADTGNNIIRQITSGSQMGRVAGRGLPGGFVDGVVGTGQMNGPEAVAVAPNGDVYIADTGNHAIRLLSAGVLSTVLGTGIPGSTPDGPVISGSITTPRGIAVDAVGAVFFTDAGMVRRLYQGVLYTVASGFTDLRQIALDRQGGLLVATGNQNKIVRLGGCGQMVISPVYPICLPSTASANSAHSDGKPQAKNAPLNASFVVAPNPVPAGGDLCLYFKEAPLSASWQVYNMAGERVLSASFFGQSQQCVANTLAPGVYIVQVQARGFSGTSVTQTRKVAVTR